MQRVGLQRFARRRLGDPVERSCAEKIDRDRAADNDESRSRGLDRMRLRAEQPLHGLEDHNRRKQKQQCRFGKRGHALDLAVAKLMLGVGRLVGNADGKIGQQCRRKVDQGVTGLRENRQRAGHEPDCGLGRCEPRGRDNRSERGFFLGVHAGPRPQGLTVGEGSVNVRFEAHH